MVVDNWTPVNTLVRLTELPAIGSFDVSRTVPSTVAVSNCPKALTVSSRVVRATCSKLEEGTVVAFIIFVIVGQELVREIPLKIAATFVAAMNRIVQFSDRAKDLSLSKTNIAQDLTSARKKMGQ